MIRIARGRIFQPGLVGLGRSGPVGSWRGGGADRSGGERVGGWRVGGAVSGAGGAVVGAAVRGVGRAGGGAPAGGGPGRAWVIRVGHGGVLASRAAGWRGGGPAVGGRRSGPVGRSVGRWRRSGSASAGGEAAADWLVAAEADVGYAF